MSLSERRQLFGVHSVTPYNRSTGEPYGIAKVVKDSSIAISGELVENLGGSNPWPWGIEQGKITGEMSLKFSEYPDFVFELFLGKAVTPFNAETSGNCSTLTNKYGTSVVASTGLATATVKAAAKADLKFTKFVVKVVSPTTVDVYAMSDEDFTRGTDKEFVNDLLKVTATALTITTGAAVEIPGYGVELTGGAGTIGMTAGDTATFEVRPVNAGGGMTVRIGANGEVAPEFGCVVMAQRRSSDEMFEIDAFKCRASGLPLGFAEKAWSELEAKAKLLYDSAKNGVFDIRYIDA